MAHRACGTDAPENSLSALRLCAANGAKWVEFDVSFTSDNVAVVFHDDTVDRVTQEKGEINQMSLEQVKKLDIASQHILKDSFSPERVPTLEEFVKECLALNVKMIIDLKTFLQPEQTTKQILELFKKHPGLHSKAMVSSFWPHLIYLIRSRDPSIVCAMAWRPKFLSLSVYNEGSSGRECQARFRSPFQHGAAVLADLVLEWAVHNFLWYFLGLSAVLIHKDCLTRDYVQCWRERGVRVIAWTVNNSLQRIYLANYLRVTSMSDSMDQIPLKELTS